MRWRGARFGADRGCGRIGAMLRLAALLGSLLLVACNPYAVSAPDAGSDAPAPDRPPVESAWTNVVPAGSAVSWGRRPCTATLRYSGPGQNVQLAGSFTGWKPIAMQQVGGAFEHTLEPGADLESGKRYAYKFIVDGEWRLDRTAALRLPDGDCMNSGVQMPDCLAGPEVVGEATEATASGDQGTVKARFKVAAAADGEALTEVLVSSDGKALPAGSHHLDPATGAVEVPLSGLARGKHRLRFQAKDGKGRAAEPVDLPFWIEAERFDPRDGLLYMLFTDRFAEGDGKRESAGAEVQYPADWHGGDLQGGLAAMKSGYFETLGVRTLWISPVNQQVDGHFVGRDDANQYAAYHGYWPVKAREVERRFGGSRALRDFVAEAHRRGLRVLVDLINNQVHEQHEYVQPHPDWFRRGCVCAIDPGCGWSERPFDCLFASYLPDINWLVAAAEKQFIDDAIAWLDDYDLDGFRVDAVKHVEPNSIFNLRAEVSRRFEQGGHRVLMFGETAIGADETYDFFCEKVQNPTGAGNGYSWIDIYVGSNGLDGQFDFPTGNRVLGEGLVTDTATLKDVEAALAVAQANYQASDLNVTFLGTQDSSRAASRAARDPRRDNRWGDLPAAAYSDAATYQRLRRAFTLAFTAPGVPFLYNGDEVALPGGGDPDNRRNMVLPADPGLAGLQLAEPGKAAPTLSAEQQAHLSFMRALGTARAASRVFSRGQRTVVVAEDDLDVVAWRQAGAPGLGLALINRGAAVTARAVTHPVFEGAGTLELRAGKGSATISGSTATLSIEAGEAGVLVAK
jgi:neopullulanase